MFISGTARKEGVLVGEGGLLQNHPYYPSALWIYNTSPQAKPTN